MSVCAACGVSYEPPPRPKGGRPSDKCEGCRKKTGGHARTPVTKAAAKRRSNAKGRRARAAKAGEILGGDDLILYQLAAGLSAGCGPRVAAALIGLHRSAKEVEALAARARRLHPELSAGDGGARTRLFASCSMIMTLKAIEAAEIVNPGQRAHGAAQMMRAAETSNELKPPETAPGAIAIEVVGSGGAPLRLVEGPKTAVNEHLK